MFFWKRKQKEAICKHDWVLNDIYGKAINEYYQVVIENRYVLYCNNCKTEKIVDEFDYNRMKKHNLIKG
jgi:hypothetical protein